MFIKARSIVPAKMNALYLDSQKFLIALKQICVLEMINLEFQWKMRTLKGNTSGVHEILPKIGIYCYG